MLYLLGFVFTHLDLYKLILISIFFLIWDGSMDNNPFINWFGHMKSYWRMLTISIIPIVSRLNNKCSYAIFCDHTEVMLNILQRLFFMLCFIVFSDI